MEEYSRLLDNASLSDIVRGIILFKTGNKEFLIEDLKKRLEKVSSSYPRLSNQLYSTVDNLLFFDSNLILTGATDSYELSRKGRRIYSIRLKERYGSQTMKRLKILSQQVWSDN